MYGREKKLSEPNKLGKSKKKTKEILFYLMRTKSIIKAKIIRDIWTLFETEEEEKERKELEKKKRHNKRLITDKLISDIRTLFEKEEDYYKSKRVSNLWNNNYIIYESNGDKLDEYLNKIEPYSRNIITGLQNSHTWKIKLIIACKFISSKDAQQCVQCTQRVTK